ncbi:MAG TPA: nucleotidyl transferase AbiEii/AbiGii toxin family protein [Pirellulales bacterium]|nr:nucleotidyl transferase AbiEii/AbiGii toxin family protein [Pirellulales bacterium]
MPDSMETRAAASTEPAAPALLPVASVVPYEQRLNDDPRWALSEGGKHFEERSAVPLALRKIAARLAELHIPYAVVGGMALFKHGLRRFTEDVDILVTREALSTIHKELEGRGYMRAFTGSKNLRDTEHGVRVEFLIAGQFPGDGKPKPVAFPEPDAVSVEFDGVRYVTLPTLVELKLASGMNYVDRAKDLVDVQELIKQRVLSKDFADQLHPFVRAKYLELWQAFRQTPTRYVTIWRNKFLTIDAKSLDEMIEGAREAAALLDAMRADGVTLDSGGGTADDYAYLVTTDPEVARKYDMHDEREFLDEDDGRR